MKNKIRKALYNLAEKACDEAVMVYKAGKKLSRYKLMRLKALVKLVLHTDCWF